MINKRIKKIKKKAPLKSTAPFIHMDDDIICPICLKYMVNTVSTKCGHNFCEFCLNEYLLLFKNCPKCKSSLRNKKYGFCTVLDSIIE